jgi:hypothetical protein
MIGNATPGMAICQEEVFGPVLAVTPYAVLELGRRSTEQDGRIVPAWLGGG